jgi:hypothetical protein
MLKTRPLTKSFSSQEISLSFQVSGYPSGQHRRVSAAIESSSHVSLRALVSASDGRFKTSQ